MRDTPTHTGDRQWLPAHPPFPGNGIDACHPFTKGKDTGVKQAWVSERTGARAGEHPPLHRLQIPLHRLHRRHLFWSERGRGGQAVRLFQRLLALPLHLPPLIV